MTEDQITMGEIARTLARMDRESTTYREAQQEQLRLLGVSLSVLAARLESLNGHEIRLAAHDRQLTEIETDLKDVRTQAAFVSGATGLAAFAASFFFTKH